MPSFKLKATEQDASTAIIQTFHPKWNEPLIGNEVSIVFRKTGPRAFRPELMYAYVSGPISAIVARMSITSYDYLPLNDALSIADDGRISVADLRSYADQYSNLLVIGIGPVEEAPTPISYHTLSTEYGFFPSSTFIPLSQMGVDTLNRLGDFSAKRKKSRTNQNFSSQGTQDE